MFILTFRQLKLATALSVVELLVQYFFYFMPHQIADTLSCLSNHSRETCLSLAKKAMDAG